jgi:DNA (cytosine-5)-methyltransferase 1
MKVLSLFSGVGGFDLGLERAGMQTVFQCEWDKHATKILERHWPNVPRWDDISTLTGKHILQHAPVIDIVAWGSPCQDLSVAGKRTGLDGSRSGLFHEGIRIIKELQEETHGKYPRISLWENVYGALNSNKGADFGVILDEMAEAGSLVQEWRVLDAQYFGVPQRRRRVFLISIFDPATAARCPDPLLPVSESVRRDTEAGAATREEPASETAASFGSSNFGGWAETDTAITLSARDHKGGNTVAVESLTPSQFAQYTEGVGTLRANGGDLGGGSETLIAGTLTVSDLTRQVTNEIVTKNLLQVETFTKGKRAQTADDDETWDENRPAPTLNAFDQGDTRATTVVAFATNQRAELRDLKDKAVALSAEPGTNQQTYIAFENSYRDGIRIATEDVSQTLSAKMGTGGNNTPMVAFGIQGNVIGRQDHNGPAGKGHTDEGDPMYTLTSTDIHAIATTMAVRRLTPIECERLMGWPDGWTDGQADTHRYKQCGNGVASPVATWIAHHLQQLDKEPNATPTQTTTTQIPSTPTPQTPPTHLR